MTVDTIQQLSAMRQENVKKAHQFSNHALQEMLHPRLTVSSAVIQSPFVPGMPSLGTTPQYFEGARNFFTDASGMRFSF